MIVIQRTLDRRTGSEGPSYDPYQYDEITVTTKFSTGEQRHITIHTGLGEWLKVNDVEVPIEADFNDHHTMFCATVEREVGISLGRLMSIVNKLEYPSKCPKCGSKHFNYYEGYVGETITFCANCEAFINNNFHVSMIE